MDISELIKLASNKKGNIPQILYILFEHIQNMGKNLENLDMVLKKIADYHKKELSECQKQINEMQQQLQILQTWRDTKTTTTIDRKTKNEQSI